MKLTKEPAFKTWDLGDLPGTPQTEKSQGILDEQLIKRPEEKAGKTGESFIEFSTRVLTAIKKLIETAPHNTVVLTHNSVFGLIKLWDKKGRPKNLDRPFRTEYTKQGSDTGDFFKIKSKSGELYICRHGETQDNLDGNFRQDDVDLTDKGRKEAEDLGKELKKDGITEIVSSPLPRTLETAEIITKAVEGEEDKKPDEPAKEEPEEESKGLCRSTFLYMNPKGDEHKFAQCGTCWKFTGKSCLEFGPDDKVGEDDSCGLYCFGEPQPDHVGKEKSGTTPEEAGFVDGEVRCENCEYFEKGDNDCLLFRMLGMKDYKVHKHGCCNAFSEKGEED